MRLKPQRYLALTALGLGLLLVGLALHQPFAKGFSIGDGLVSILASLVLVARARPRR